MLSFTLDTNCIVAIDESRAEAAAVRRLADAHANGTADVAIAASSASERQQDQSYLRTFVPFQQRLEKLGLTHLPLIHPLLYANIGFWEYTEWGTPAGGELERQIHCILFPSHPYDYTDLPEAERAQAADDPNHPADSVRKWRNRMCDVQALWTHIHQNRDVFVTADNNFHARAKGAALRMIGAGRIETPEAAAALL